MTHSAGATVVDRIVSSGWWSTSIVPNIQSIFSLAPALAGSRASSALYGVDGYSGWCSTLVSWLAGWAIKNNGAQSLTRGSVIGEANAGHQGRSPIWINKQTTTGGSWSANNDGCGTLWNGVTVREDDNDCAMGALAVCLGYSNSDDMDGLLYWSDSYSTNNTSANGCNTTDTYDGNGVNSCHYYSQFTGNYKHGSPRGPTTATAATTPTTRSATSRPRAGATTARRARAWGITFPERWLAALRLAASDDVARTRRARCSRSSYCSCCSARRRRRSSLLPAPPEPVAQAPAAAPLPRAQRPPSAAPRPASSEGYVPVDPRVEEEINPSAAMGMGPYPPGSQPLTEGTDPRMQPPEDDTVDAEHGIRCVFGPRVGALHPPDPIILDLEVFNSLGAHLPITEGVARFRPENGSPDKGPWFKVAFADNGAAPDLLPNDMKYTATLSPDAAQQAQLLAGGTHVMVEVAFMAPNGLGPRKYSTVVRYNRQPDASLNGKYAEAVAGGSLVVNVGVTATQPGDYRVIASLYGGDQAIAFASQVAHLDAGDGSVPLTFFGKILHDSKIDGPYELRYMMLSQRLGPDTLLGDTLDPAFTTQFYRAAQFSPDAYVQAPQGPPVEDDKPAVISLADREKINGATATIRADPPNRPAQPAPAGTK